MSFPNMKFRPSMITRPVVSFYFGLFLVMIPLLTLITIFASSDNFGNTDHNLSVESLLGNRIVELSERIKHAEMLNQERKREINQLVNQISIMNKSSANSTAIGSSLHRMGNIPDALGSSLLQVPSISNFLPHLLNSRDPLQPAVRRVSREFYPLGRTGVSIVFGVPTVKRPVESYLFSTLVNLIDNLSPEEKHQAVIVVFIAETDLDYVTKQATAIEHQFEDYINSGLLEVISPPVGFYPDFNSSLKLSLGDPASRVRWRTKQNLDFAYLMMYCQPKATYYVQLEDDILSKPGYLTKMKHFAFKQSISKKEWFLLDFCQLGFIGKMFKSIDLSKLALFFIMFRADKPVDWLLVDLAETHYCRIDKDMKDCKKQIALHWLHFRPSLFQHIGTHSSLKGKVQKLRDKNFGKMALFYPHKDNPPAEATTSLNHYKLHSISRAYSGDNFFWGLDPSLGDHIAFNFTPPVALTNYYFRTGNWEHPEDRLPANSTVELQLDNERLATRNTSIPRTGDGYLVVGAFRLNGLAEGQIPPGLGLIRSLRIVCQQDSQRWVILSEIMFKRDAG